MSRGSFSKPEPPGDGYAVTVSSTRIVETIAILPPKAPPGHELLINEL